MATLKAQELNIRQKHFVKHVKMDACNSSVSKDSTFVRRKNLVGTRQKRRRIQKEVAEFISITTGVE